MTFEQYWYQESSRRTTGQGVAFAIWLKEVMSEAFEAGREQGWNESNQMQKESE